MAPKGSGEGAAINAACGKPRLLVACSMKFPVGPTTERDGVAIRGSTAEATLGISAQQVMDLDGAGARIDRTVEATQEA